MRSINTGSQNLSIGTYLYHRNLVCPSQIGHQRMQHTRLGSRPTQAEAVVYLCEPSERQGLHILLRDFLDVLQRVNWNNVRKCQIWSDKGRHCIGAVTISTLGFIIPYEHRYYLPDDPVPWCVESEQCGGMAKHFKNP